MDKLTNWYTFINYIRQRYIADSCDKTAAALTYMSLFALVPLLTVMYTMLSAVPSFQQSGGQIEAFIFDHFIPSTGTEVKEYLMDFSSQTRKLSGVGIIVLIITAILMLKNIEKNFNAIWRTEENRNTLSSFLLYWAILSLGPLFIGLALGISTYLLSLKIFTQDIDTLGLGPMLLGFLPYLLTALAMTLLFAAVPNAKVSIKHAAIGGLITALLFEIAKQLFTRLAAFSSYEMIYGAFAAIPLFLMWIYLSWLIVLAGAELVHALEGFNADCRHQYCDLVASLGILEQLWQKHQTGEALREQDILRTPWLFGQYTLSSDQWTPIRSKLLAAGLITVSQSRDFILGRDLNHYSLADLCKELDLLVEPFKEEAGQLPPWFCASREKIQQAHLNNLETLSTPLAQLYEHETISV